MKTALRIFLLLLITLFVARLSLFPDSDREPWEEAYALAGYDFRPGPSSCVGVETRDAVMGTRFAIEVHAPDEASVDAARRAAWRRIYDLEWTFSAWIADSFLSRLNGRAAEGPVAVDDDFLAVLAASRETWEDSGGVFDPTIGPLLAVWKPLARMQALPPAADIEQARRLVGFDHVIHYPEARTVRFGKPGMVLNFGGVAKGYAAGEAARAAREAGATAVRVNAGGDVVASGIPPGSEHGFEFLVRDPEGGRTDTLPGRSFVLRDGAVATSGNYERYTEIDGRRYSHIIDPRTGRPVEDAVVQVTVIAPTGARADALATALTVLGAEEGVALADRLEQVEALFLVRREGKIVQVHSRGFPGIDR